MKTGRFLEVLACLVLCVYPQILQARTWTNSEGVQIEAELVKAEGDKVTLRLANGKVVSFAQEKLSEADREFIKSASAKPEPAKPEPEKPSPHANRKARWLTSMDKAKDEAKETGLPILVLFTGTTWCPYCVKLEKEVFDKKEFKEYANQHLVLLILDFEPGGKAKNSANAKLQKEFGVGGFPTYFLCDAEGKSKAGGGYHSGITPEAFAGWVDRVVAAP